MLGSDKDPTWRDFPQALMETQGARQYVTLFEIPFEAFVLSDFYITHLPIFSLSMVMSRSVVIWLLECSPFLPTG